MFSSEPHFFTMSVKGVINPMQKPNYNLPVKAIRAPLDGSPITKGAFGPVERPYQMCSRCVMDTTDPEIHFDEQGVCSHCFYFDSEIRPIWPSNNGNPDSLNLLIDTVKSYGEGKRYDCIIGLSGGVDSSYLAVKLAEWGIRPLVVHVDAGWNSELAVMNIEAICNRLNFELVTHVVDWEEMRDVQLAFLRSNVANQDTPQDHAFFSALYTFAKKANIKYVFEGSNFSTESILPQAWGYDALDGKHVRAVHRKLGDRSLGNFPTISFFDLYINFRFIKKMKAVRPLDLLPYRKEEAISVLQDKYGWRYYGGKHYESRWTRFFQSYYLPYKFGYDKRKAHLSSLIVSGQVTRETALGQIGLPLCDLKTIDDDKLFIAKKLGIQKYELELLIDQDCRHFSEFPNSKKLKDFLVKSKMFLRNL